MPRRSCASSPMASRGSPTPSSTPARERPRRGSRRRASSRVTGCCWQAPTTPTGPSRAWRAARGRRGRARRRRDGAGAPRQRAAGVAREGGALRPHGHRANGGAGGRHRDGPARRDRIRRRAQPARPCSAHARHPGLGDLHQRNDLGPQGRDAHPRELHLPHRGAGSRVSVDAGRPGAVGAAAAPHLRVHLRVAPAARVRGEGGLPRRAHGREGGLLDARGPHHGHGGRPRALAVARATDRGPGARARARRGRGLRHGARLQPCARPQGGRRRGAGAVRAGAPGPRGLAQVPHLGGAALPKETAEVFAGLGLHLRRGLRGSPRTPPSSRSPARSPGR